MSFYVVERDPDDGSLRSVTPGLADRAAAVQVLQDLLAAGTVTVTGDLFVLDLDSAAPVIVLPPVPMPPAEPLTEPMLDETPGIEETSGLDEAATALSAPDVFDTPAEDAPDQEGPIETGDDLASALRRAATSLESEGVVAPESVSGLDAADDDTAADSEEPRIEPVGEDWPWMGVTAVEEVLPDVDAEDLEPAGDVEPDAAAHSELDEGAAEPELEDEVVAEAGHDAVEPVVNDDEGLDHEEPSVADQVSALLGSLAEPVVSHVAEPAGVAEASAPEPVVASDLDEPSVEDSPLIVPSAIDDEVYLPRPVILGDYEDAAETAPQEAPAEAATEVPAETAPADPDVALPEIDYVPSGELDLDTYTCDDCVYVYTCPKVGESSPKECGSFQWKSN
ncbi:MAG: hypothetical protein ISP10_06255 [Aeromicrobium sp.]|nr:hypothetical protein [Aeromicrobium sp.]